MASTDAENRSSLFAGLKFFLVQRMPSRSRFVNDIETNGGSVCKLEAQADHIIADHARKDAPPGSLSYRFIEDALQSGHLPRPEDHPAAQAQAPAASSARPIGSVSGNRTTRTPFTHEDDVMLYRWVQTHSATSEYTRNSAKGNEIYRALAEKNPRHTAHSWRDRYVKHLSFRPPNLVSDGAHDSAPPATIQATLAQDRAQTPSDLPVRTSEVHLTSSNDFTDQETQLLFEFAPLIRDVPMRKWRRMWAEFAESHPTHTADQWQSYYMTKVDPVLEEREELVAQIVQETRDSMSGKAQDDNSPVGTKRKRQDDQDESQNSSPPRSTKRQRTAEARHVAQEQSPTSPRPPENGYMSPSRPESVAPGLTTENLANLQTHGSAQRGTDLTPDSPDQDREGFVQYLNDIVVRNALPTVSADAAEISESENEQVVSQPSAPPESLPDDSSIDDEPQTNEVSEVYDSDTELSTAAHPLVNNIQTSNVNIAATSNTDILPPFKVDSLSSTSDDDEDDDEFPPFAGNCDTNTSYRIQLDIPGSDVILAESSYPESSDSILPSLEVLMQQTASKRAASQNHTQDLFALGTQAPDLSMPEMPTFSDDSEADSDDDPSRHALPHVDPLEAPLDVEGLSQYVQDKAAAGYDVDQIRHALERTSMRANLADAVLGLLDKGKGVPGGFRGIWTEEDDNDLRGGDSVRIRRLEKIHLGKELEQRLDWLTEYHRT